MGDESGVVVVEAQHGGTWPPDPSRTGTPHVVTGIAPAIGSNRSVTGPSLVRRARVTAWQ